MATRLWVVLSTLLVFTIPASLGPGPPRSSMAEAYRVRGGIRDDSDGSFDYEAESAVVDPDDIELEAYALGFCVQVLSDKPGEEISKVQSQAQFGESSSWPFGKYKGILTNPSGISLSTDLEVLGAEGEYDFNIDADEEAEIEFYIDGLFIASSPGGRLMSVTANLTEPTHTITIHYLTDYITSDPSTAFMSVTWNGNFTQGSTKLWASGNSRIVPTAPCCDRGLCFVKETMPAARNNTWAMLEDNGVETALASNIDGILELLAPADQQISVVITDGQEPDTFSFSFFGSLIGAVGGGAAVGALGVYIHRRRARVWNSRLQQQTRQGMSFDNNPMEVSHEGKGTNLDGSFNSTQIDNFPAHCNFAAYDDSDLDRTNLSSSNFSETVQNRFPPGTVLPRRKERLLPWLRRQVNPGCTLEAMRSIAAVMQTALETTGQLPLLLFPDDLQIDKYGNVHWVSPSPENVDRNRLAYAAPEVLTHGVDAITHREAASVWAFACVCVKLLTDISPFTYLKPESTQDVSDIVQTKARPYKAYDSFSSDGAVPIEVVRLLEKCHNAIPSERPHLGELIITLSGASSRRCSEDTELHRSVSQLNASVAAAALRNLPSNQQSSYLTGLEEDIAQHQPPPPERAPPTPEDDAREETDSGILTLNDFSIGDIIGGKGRQVAMRAMSRRTGTSGVLKSSIAPGVQDPKEFHQVTRACSQRLQELSHPNVLQFYDCFYQTDEEMAYVFTEEFEGQTLSQVMEARKVGLEHEAIVKIGKGLVAALDHIHKMGLLHTGLSPDVIVLGSDGNVKVGGFGCILQSKSLSIEMIGAPHYCAPEVVGHTGPCTSKSDVWSLGCILYELCTGQKPFHCSSVLQVTERICAGVFRPLPSTVDAKLARTVHQCLETDAAKRPDLDALLNNVLWRQHSQSKSHPVSVEAPVASLYHGPSVSSSTDSQNLLPSTSPRSTEPRPPPPTVQDPSRLEEVVRRRAERRASRLATPPTPPENQGAKPP